MGLEGLISKCRDRPYQAGRSKHWIKVKNRQHPSMDRVKEFLPIRDEYHCSRSALVFCFMGSTVGRCRIGAGQLESS
jgi:ATP-dependent DNA ligase